MRGAEPAAMRDAFIRGVHLRMKTDPRLIFLSADFGSPRLDLLKAEFPERFVNVGIAEQNLVNLATGLALEGFKVFAYAIAPFLTMRAYDQIRNNLSLLAQLKPVNVNLVGVGTGLSYGLSGPSHHCLEDISIMNTLPGLAIYSPSDWVLARKMADLAAETEGPKYFRFDGKPLPPIYLGRVPKLETGLCRLAGGDEIALLATGYMTRQALEASRRLKREGIRVGVVDVFRLKPFPRRELRRIARGYRLIITLEEAFLHKGGLDGIVADALSGDQGTVRLAKIGFGDRHLFEVGSREYLLARAQLDVDGLVRTVKRHLKNIQR